MIVLAIDITTPLGSLALTRKGHLLEEFLLEASAGFGEVIFAALDSLLKRHACAVQQVDLFAAASDPGTFTGVRMGLTLVQGLAEALGKPVRGVSNLEALAATGEGEYRAPVIDARRGQYYTALFDALGHLQQPESLQTLDEFRRSLPAGVEPMFQTVPLAAAIAAIAAQRDPQDPAQLAPNYIRRSDAELSLNAHPLSSPHT